jgi:hypothetical protein
MFRSQYSGGKSSTLPTGPAPRQSLSGGIRNPGVGIYSGIGNTSGEIDPSVPFSVPEDGSAAYTPVVHNIPVPVVKCRKRTPMHRVLLVVWVETRIAQ